MKEQFKVKADKELMMMLSSGVYKDKILAVIRELGSNALDAVTECGGEVKFKLYTKNGKHLLIISDTACGLEPQQVIDLMSTYGNSTKRENDKVNGKFGIGSKSPFAYTDLFFIKSNKNGKAHYFKCFKDDEGIPYIEYIKCEDTDEPNGLTFSIEVNPKDIKNFITIIIGFVATQEIGTPISGEIKLSVPEEIMELSGWRQSYNRGFLHNIEIKAIPCMESVSDNDSIYSYYKYSKNFHTEIYSKAVLNGVSDNDTSYKLFNSLTYGDNKTIYNKYFVNIFWNSLGSNVCKLGSALYEFNIDKKIPYSNKVIFKIDPKDIAVTSSREDIVNNASNKKKLNEIINKYEKYLSSKTDGTRSLIDIVADENSPLRKLMNEIDVRSIDRNDIEENLYFKFEADKKYLKSVVLNGENDELISIALDNTMLNMRMLEEFSTSYGGKAPSTTLNDTYYINSDQHLVFCAFTRQGIDVRKILDKYNLKSKNTVMFFIDKKDLKNIVAIKRAYGYFSSTKVFENQTIYIEESQRKNFAYDKQTEKTSASASTGLYTIYKLEPIKNESKTSNTYYNAVKLDTADPRRKMIYLFKYRNELHLVTTPHCYTDAGTSYSSIANLPLSVSHKYLNLIYDKVQFCVFNSRANAVKYFKKNTKDFVNYFNVTAEVIEETLMNDKYKIARHALTLFAKELNRRSYLSSKIFKENCIYEYAIKDLLKIDDNEINFNANAIHNLESLMHNNRLSRQLDSIGAFDKFVTDSELYQKLKHLYAFAEFVEDALTWTAKERFNDKYWNLYKKTNIENDPNFQDYNIFKESN